MINVKEIREKLEYYQKTLYAQTRADQAEDIKYYDDTFSVPWIRPPLIVSRTGSGAEMIDNAVAQLGSCMPKVYRDPLTDSATAKEASNRVAEIINNWMIMFMKRNPNPITEIFKNTLLMGEHWIHPIHNMSWVTSPYEKTGLPIIFMIPNPMVVFASPNEDENGVPEDFILYYERLPSVIKTLYPAWTNPMKKGDKKNPTSSWLAYFDSKYRYFEADGEAVLKGDSGIQPNLYGITPAIHKVSGFGKSSPEGKMEELIVGRLRKYRDLLARDAASTSDIDSIIHLFANNTITVQPGDTATQIPKDFREKFEIGPGKLIELPANLKVDTFKGALPEPQVLQWNYMLQAQLGKKIPASLMGMPAAESGRLQDLLYSAAMSAFGANIMDMENSIATAIGMGLRICDKLMRDDVVKSKDLNGNYTVKVELRPEDPVDRDRKIMAGRTMVSSGLRSIRTFLIKDVGMTQDEADDEIDEILAEKYLLQSPDIAQLIEIRAAEKSGMAQDLQALQAQKTAAEQRLKRFPLGNQLGSRGGEPRTGNIQTEMGQNMADVAMTQGGVRSTRGA
jgi:hypothetical protein